MNTPRRLLQLGPLPPGLAALLAPGYQLHPLWQEPDRGAFLSSVAGRFDGAVMMSRHGCPAEVIEVIAGGVVGCFGVGFEGIDLQAAQRHRVQVSTTPDVLTDCVADLAFGLILATARKLVAADRFVRAGRWPEGSFGLSTRVGGKRLGIVGLGRIGAAIARRSTGFDMTVRYFGPRQRTDVEYAYEPDLLALADWADFLVIACRGGPSTHRLIDAGVLDALGPRGALVNVARGSVVDQGALIAALREGRIAGAGLDVFEDEPRVPPELMADERLVLLPHVGALTSETRAAMEELVRDNLDSFFATGKVLTPPY